MESTATGYVGEESGDDPARDNAESAEETDEGAAIDALEVEFEELSRESIQVDAFLSDKDQVRKLLKFGWKLTRNADEAMELAHDAIAKSLTSLRTEPRPPGMIIKFLKTTMLRTHFTQLRAKKRARDYGDHGDGLPTLRDDGEEGSVDLRDDSHGLPSGVSLQEACVLREDIDNRIVAAVRKLPTDQQHVVALALGLHMKYPHRCFTQTEIADFLGIPQDRVKSRWRQGLVSLRASLGPFWDDWKKS